MKMDKTAIQKFQDEFCMASHLYCSCLNEKQEIITQLYGTDQERAFLNQYLEQEKLFQVIQRVMDSTLENVVEEELECGFIKLYAVAIRMDKELVAVWLVQGIIKEAIPQELSLPQQVKSISQEDFYNNVKFLYTYSKQYFTACMEAETAQEETQRSILARKQMETDLKRSEVMNRVIQMLESENDFGQIIQEILENVCEYLDISGGNLLKINQDNQLVDMICMWHSPDVEIKVSDYIGVAKSNYPFMTGKPYMISSNSSMPLEFRKFFEKEQLRAGIFLPVEVNHQVIMYINFTERRGERIWDIMDIKFLNNVKKIIQSILSKRITKNSLAGSYISLEAILESIGCGICVKDFENKGILFSNERFRTYFEKSIADETLDQLLVKPQGDGENGNCSEYYMDSEDKWFNIHYTEIVWVNGKTVSLYTVYDTTDTKRYQQKIERQANRDFLTGLYNRMRCEQDLTEHIRQSRELDRQGALLYIDLDDFKHINDGLGHRYGDVLLKAISHSLQRVKGIESTCYRMGGDEFIIIVTHYNYPMLNRILQEIEGIFSKPWFLKGADYYCTMSMGVVRFPADGDTVQEVIQKADIALYEAKKSGKNRCEFYSDNVESTSFKRLDLEKNMRNATINSCDEFEVYYQPIFDVTQPGNPCTGAEALIRWNSQSMGFISPTEFIPLAEYLGLINPIGDYVLRQACEQCKYWNDIGHPEYKVNVNLSVVQLLQNSVVEKIAEVIKETHIIPSNLTLEVTESLAVNDMARMKMILGKIKALGVRVALDDFGTGYSSLNHIREMPIDVIKIDRCFIMDIGKDEFADVFVKVVAELANTIGMHLCVEGVETKEQFEMLKDMNIPLVQGFYFDKPLPAREFERKYL